VGGYLTASYQSGRGIASPPTRPIGPHRKEAGSRPN